MGGYQLIMYLYVVNTQNSKIEFICPQHPFEYTCVLCLFF